MSPDQIFADDLTRTLKLLAATLNVRGLEFLPRPTSPLFKTNPSNLPTSCTLQLDQVMCPAILLGHAWEVVDLEWIDGALQYIEGDLTLVDVGANSGFFTRQALLRSPRFAKAFVYEPHPTNYRHLCHNLSPFCNVAFNNCALSNLSGDLEFYLDPNNSGNYSLNRAAMPPDYLTTRVPVVSVTGETKKWTDPVRPIFYKSDTQGYDELIASHIDAATWDHIHAGFFELWRIAKPPSVDWNTFAAILDRFPFKTFTTNPENLSTGRILQYLKVEDGQFKDLFFCRHSI